MFYDKYINEEEKELVTENYYAVLNVIDNENALKIIAILENNGCNFVNDLITNYMEIFMLKPYIIETKLKILKNELGNSYMNVIESNLNLLVE